MKGEITREFTIWCGTCINWYRIDRRTKKQAINFFRYSHGWKCSKENGWICPACANRGLGSNNPELLTGGKADGGETE